MEKVSFRSPMKKKPVINNVKISCRSPQNKKQLYKNEPIYKIVTQTYAGHPVKVPTENVKPNFIQFKSKPLPMPLKNEDKIELIKINKRKKYKFDDALMIYENNQSYYLNLIKNDPSIVDIVIKDVELLERWFCQISEPKPENEDEIDEWEKREEFKHIYHYSKYFDPTLLYYYCNLH